MGPHSIRDAGFTLFVDNLPINMNNFWLRQIFKFDGEVVDVFVSRKQRRYSKLAFGFVRFKIKMDAERAILRNDNLKIRGVCIKVGWAKYVMRGVHDFKSRKEAEVGRRVWGREPLWKPASRDKQTSLERKWKGCEDEQREDNQDVKWAGSSESNDFTRQFCVDRNNENVEWLSRSIIGDTYYPTTLKALKSKIYADWPSILKIRDMGGVRFLITFETREEMEEVLNDENCLLKEHFVELKAWSICEVGNSRRTWIECHGIPPHGWSSENLKKVGELWGDMICFDYLTESMESLGTARIQIETNFFKVINEKIRLMVEEAGFVVFVRETGVAPVLFNKAHAENRREGKFSEETSELPGSPWLSSGNCAEDDKDAERRNRNVGEVQREIVNGGELSTCSPLDVETGNQKVEGGSRSKEKEADELQKNLALVPFCDDGIDNLKDWEIRRDPNNVEVVTCSLGAIDLTVDLNFEKRVQTGEEMESLEKCNKENGPLFKLDGGLVFGSLGKDFELVEEVEHLDRLDKEVGHFYRKAPCKRKVGRPKKQKKKEKIGIQKGKKSFHIFDGELNHTGFDVWEEDDENVDDREGNSESEARKTWTLGKALGLSS